MIMKTIDRTSEFDPADIEANRIYGALSYLWILFLVPLFACPKSAFGKFHANQGLVVFLIEIVLNVIFAIASTILGLIPILGAIAVTLLGLVQSVINLAMFILVIYCLIQALNSKVIELPFIGNIKIIK